MIANNRADVPPFGHMVVGRKRIALMDEDHMVLDCGCIYRRKELIDHVWTMELDFNKCIHHECGDDCKR